MGHTPRAPESIQEVMKSRSTVRRTGFPTLEDLWAKLFIPQQVQSHALFVHHGGKSPLRGTEMYAPTAAKDPAFYTAL
jgi:hypothetical protein